MKIILFKTSISLHLYKVMFSNEKQPAENTTLQSVMCLNRIWPNIL